MDREKLEKVGWQCIGLGILGFVTATILAAFNANEWEIWGNASAFFDTVLSEIAQWNVNPVLIWVGIVTGLIIFVRIFLWTTHKECDSWKGEKFAENTRSWTLVFLFLTGINVAILLVIVAHFHSQGCYDVPESGSQKGCGNFDAIGISVTAIEIALILVGLIGLWAIRNLAETTSTTISKSVANSRFEEWRQVDSKSDIKDAIVDIVSGPDNETKVFHPILAKFTDDLSAQISANPDVQEEIEKIVKRVILKSNQGGS